jgi:hypothetical protein
MVTKHFMEKMMVSARESRKITKQIERVTVIKRRRGSQPVMLRQMGRAEDVFVKGIADERFDGDKMHRSQGTPYTRRG